jgi:tryptophan-rich sensory protein
MTYVTLYESPSEKPYPYFDILKVVKLTTYLYMKINIKKLILALILPQLAGILGSFFVTPNIEGWYSTLNRPKFTPPNWLFAPAWTTLFILMSISLYFVYISEKSKNKDIYTTFFYIQLLLNFLWNVLFFGLNNPSLGLIEIVVLTVTVVVTIVYGFKVKKVSGYLLIPYLLWLLFAGALNLAIYTLN